jgi:hypothetical protein
MLNAAQSETAPVYRSLSQIARRFPPNRESKPVHTATLTRWILKGHRASDGSQIRLRATRFPSGWRSTDQWVSDFLDAITHDRTGQRTGQVDSNRTPTDRGRAFERVERELDRIGI